MASIDKRNGKWRARYRDPSGEQRSKQFVRKIDAQRFLNEQTAATVTGQYVSPDAGKITFRDYAEQWRTAQVHRPTTAASYETQLRRHAYPAFGDRPLHSILPSNIQAWVKGLTLDLAPSTVAVTHGIVASVFKAAVRDKRIFTNPCEGTKLPEVHRDPVVPLAIEDVHAIEASLPDRYRAMVTLAAATGMRQAEVLGLTVDRSGLRPPSSKPTLRVDRQLLILANEPPFLGPPKRAASRRDLPLPQVAVDALVGHLAAFPAFPQDIPVRDHGHRLSTETVELVFTTEAGKPIRRSSFSDTWRQAIRSTGIEATFHDLRHFYASLLIRHGESVKVVQARLGHASATETLDTYSHLWPDSEDRTRDAVDSAFRVPGVSQQAR